MVAQMTCSSPSCHIFCTRVRSSGERLLSQSVSLGHCIDAGQYALSMIVFGLDVVTVTQVCCDLFASFLAETVHDTALPIVVIFDIRGDLFNRLRSLLSNFIAQIGSIKALP